jgi:hypothetical protein
MEQKFRDFQTSVEAFQEQVDALSLSDKVITPQKFESLMHELKELNTALDSFKSAPEHSAISYRLQIQHYRSILKQLEVNLTPLKPTLNIPLGKPVNVTELYTVYLEAQRFYLKDDTYTLDEEPFLEFVKKARMRARKYYEGAKTQVAIDLDENGPYIQIKRRAA